MPSKTTTNLDALPGVIPLTNPNLYRELGFPSQGSLYRARSRGVFPVRVIERGGTLAVLKIDLIRYLENGETQASGAPIKTRNVKKKNGRPTKSELAEARDLKITISELRARRLGG